MRIGTNLRSINQLWYRAPSQQLKRYVRAEFEARQREGAPHSDNEIRDYRHMSDEEAWRLLERDLKENPDLWPLLDHEALR